MMKTCADGCGQWAQWKVSRPEKDADGKLKYLVTVALVCGQHKQAREKAAESADPKQDLRFNFVGAVPDGAHRS